jgi:PASTA domain
MATKWVITTPSDRVDLDQTQQGQTTFTVTNPTARVDRVVFDIVPGDGADPTWFSVEEPQRRVAASGSVSYLMKTAIPATAAAGAYSVQGRAYSADSTPEEDSVLSSRLAVEVKAKAAPVAKKRPWWILVVAALVVIVLVVVGLVIGLRKPARPATTTAGPDQVTMPDLAQQSQKQATTNLTAFGLTAGVIRHKMDATPDRVVYQSVPGGTKVAKGSPVDLVVTAVLAAPMITAPPPASVVPARAVAPPTTPLPTNPAPNPSAAASGPASPAPSPSAPAAETGVLRWTDPDPFVKRWQVTIQQQVCARVVNYPFIPPPPPCYFLTSILVQVDHPWYTPILPPGGRYDAPYYSAEATTSFQWQVAPLDDFGAVGRPSPFAIFTVR